MKENRKWRKDTFRSRNEMKGQRFSISLFLLLFLLGAGSGLRAQQDALYSQYMFSTFTINPAFAGTKESSSGLLLYRTQWVGFDGAPQSGAFSFHTPIKGKNFALGMNAVQESVGPTNNTAALLSYAYHLKLGEGKLSLGLRGGGFRSSFNANELNYKEPDKYSGAGRTSAIVPSFDFGAYYYTDRYYAGLSATHLTQRELEYELPDGAGFMELERHFMATGGAAFQLGPELVFRPSTLVKFIPSAPLNVDLNASFLLHDALWLGASYRTDQSLVFIAEYNITDYLRTGYSFDYGLNQLQEHHSGSHEIFIGFDLDLDKGERAISPRYL